METLSIDKTTVGHAIDDIVLSKEFSINHLKVLYEPQDVLLKADKSRIDEVISNLLSNAIKFTPEGTITISVEKEETENWVIVNVKDTGQGIDVSILPRLFTKFASKSYQGTGLGLFIAKRTVEAHMGKIWGTNNTGAQFHSVCQQFKVDDETHFSIYIIHL